MAQIDTSELLTDPDFIDPISLITRTATINSYGENVLMETITAGYGSVQPISGKALARLPEALRVQNVRSFWFKGAIPVGASGSYPMIFVFRGVRFQVQFVFDWTNWGQGWSEGTCVAEVLS